jgi:hypothetical protein
MQVFLCTRGIMEFICTNGALPSMTLGIFISSLTTKSDKCRVVLLWSIGVITVAKYLYQWWRHVDMKERAKQTMRYRKAAKEAKANSAGGKPPKKKKKVEKTQEKQEEEETDPEIEVLVHGTVFLRKITHTSRCRNADVERSVCYSVTFRTIPSFHYWLQYLQKLGSPQKDYGRDLVRFVLDYAKRASQEKLGLNDEDYAKWKEQQLYKYQQRMNSAKMKRYQRWLRKH